MYMLDNAYLDFVAGGQTSTCPTGTSPQLDKVKCTFDGEQWTCKIPCGPAPKGTGPTGQG